MDSLQPNLNDKRAEFALCGLEACALASGGPSHLFAADLETWLYDLLVGLRHLADRELLDFGSISEQAGVFYARSLYAPNGEVTEPPHRVT